MSYDQFAYYYDELMDDVPYDQWIQFLEEKMKEHNVTGKDVLDLACGTGVLSVKMAQKGFRVTGVDLSDQMLAVAQEKSEESHLNIQFYQQHMRDLSGFQPFDAICIFLDSLNYLEQEEDVQAVLQRVYHHLKPGGILLFDVHTPYKMEKVFLHQTFVDMREDITVIWQCFSGEHPFSIEHELTFFEQLSDQDAYRRFDEIHFQRTYELETYLRWLDDAGFTNVQVSGDFGDVVDMTERWFFCAMKQNR